MNRYFQQYKRDIDERNKEAEKSNEKLSEYFNAMLEELDLESTGYTVSYCRDFMHTRLNNKVTNTQVKSLLIQHFGDTICFTYPKDQKQSQMFFSSRICPADVIENLRKKTFSNNIILCASELRNECKSYEFALDQSYCDASDVMLSYESYKNNRPTAWELFFDTLFPSRKKSEAIKRKCDMIFQTIFYVLHNGRKKKPIHITLAESVHDKCRSKQLIQVLNKLGLCISYQELEKIYVSLARRIINATNGYRVPIPPNILPSLMIHGAMDNFDHIENTPSGKDSSHDTILMLFQNNESFIKKTEISLKAPEDNTKISLASTLLDCQKKVYFKKSCRGEINESFKIGTFVTPKSVEQSERKDFITWYMTRKSYSDLVQFVPSWTPTKSLISLKNIVKTNIAFTPIIPYPATEFDTIFTCLKNFQDVLLQKQLPYGPLWCDEGVYRIAKEIQLLRPNEFDNIFLGLGGFHTEKVLLACIGKYIENIGVEEILVENEIFGPAVVKSVLNAGHYGRAKRGNYFIQQHSLFV